MAHNLNLNNGKHSFFSVKEIPWHGLGQIISDYPTSSEAIIHAGLDYVVEKTPLTTTYDGSTIEVPGKFATIRTDNKNILGVVGADYEIVQNVDAFTFFDSIVDDASEIKYETAGALGLGEQVFITAKLPTYMRIGKDDIIENYLFFTTTHDGTGSITAAFTPTRIVCANTLSAATRNKSHTIRLRHTLNIKSRLEMAHKLMGITNSLNEGLEEIFNQWAKVRITDENVKKLIEAAMNPGKESITIYSQEQREAFSTNFKNTVDEVFEYAMGNDTQQMETTKGTVFGAYNAVTGYFQNVKNFKNDEAKLKSIVMGGTGQVRTQLAFNLCDKYSKNTNIFN